MKNSVFIATSLDGKIADSNGGIDWLHSIPNLTNNDMGYSDFMEGIDAIVMGRTTFQTVCGFDMDWPYNKPVFVLSNTLQIIPKEHTNNVFLVNGKLTEILNSIHSKGYLNLYIDGGKTIQSFLQEDLVDEMIITQIPIILGGGASLFGLHEKPIQFECHSTKIYLDKIVQNHFKRVELK